MLGSPSAQSRIIRQRAESDRGRAILIYRQVLTEPPSEAEIDELLDYFEVQKMRFQAGELNAEELLQGKVASDERAAWTLVARVILNLDAAITKS